MPLVAGVTVKDVPVPSKAPVPHPPSYHDQTAPCPRLPPVSVSVILFPRQISLPAALLVIPVAGTEDVCTSTLKLHDELPQPFTAVQVTAVIPVLNVLPDAGEQFTTAAGVPVADGVAKVTTGLQLVMSEGQGPITGDSLIVTENEHEELPQAFVAVHVTAVVPIANDDPESGAQTTVGVVPVAEGSVHVAMVLSHCSIAPGHAPITGGVQPPMRLSVKSLISPWLFEPGRTSQPVITEVMLLATMVPVYPIQVLNR